MIKTTTAYVVAVLLTYVFGAIFISQGNLAQVISLGIDVEVTLATRLDAALHDIANMTQIYLPVLALAMLIALPVAKMIISYVPHLRLVGYTLAGFVALITVHAAVEALFGVSGIATTRFLDGLLLQGVAGAIGGLGFHLITRPAVDANAPQLSAG